MAGVTLGPVQPKHRKKSNRHSSAITASHQTKHAKTTVHVTGLEQLFNALGKLTLGRLIILLAWLPLLVFLWTRGSTAKPEEPPPNLNEPTMLVLPVVAAERARVSCDAAE